MTRVDVVNTYKGMKKALYARANKTIDDKDLLHTLEFDTTRSGSFIKAEALYKGRPDVDPVVSWRLIQPICAEATLALSTAIIPLSKKIANLPNTDSFLNKFSYVSGMDAN
jgi:hypothetical protein